MSEHRVRVRPPHSHFGLLVLSSIVAAVMAVPVAVYGWLWPQLPVDMTYRAYWLWIVNLTQAAIALIPFIIFIIWLARQCQHPRWVAFAGATYALVLTLFTMLISDLRDPHWAFQALMDHLIVLAAAPIIGAALALAGMGIYRALGRKVIEQDGTLCQQCSYPLGRSQSTACPECGEPARPIVPTRGERCIAFTALWGRSMTALMIVMLVAGYALVIHVERDYRLLEAGYGEEWLIADMGFFKNDAAEWFPYLPVDIAGYEGAVAVVLYPRPVWRRRVVELTIGQMHEWGIGDAWILSGAVDVVMPVPREHVDGVLRNGPPEAAIQNLIQAAASSGWQPRDDWATPARRIEVPWPE